MVLFEQAFYFFFMNNTIVLQSTVFITGIIIIISLLHLVKKNGGILTGVFYFANFPDNAIRYNIFSSALPMVYLFVGGAFAAYVLGKVMNIIR